tara:strand:- start:69 stop:704 length:636 start_codon:yes stop_codon:yes gene_type:complete
VALDNYGNLKDAIQDWAHRNDVSSRIDDFILIAEQEMYNNPVESLDVLDQQTKTLTDTVIGSNLIALPTGFTGMRAILIDDKTTDAQQYNLTYVTPEGMRRDPSNGCPSQFTVTSQIELNRPADAVYSIEIQHMAKPLPLNATNQTNVILTNYPTIYLAGALWALHRWAKDPESAQGAYTDFIQAIQGANLATQKASYGPSLVMRSAGHVV